MKDASGILERVEIDWRWRGDFTTLEVLPDLPSYEPDPRTQPEDYKNWMKLKFEYQRRLAEERVAAGSDTARNTEHWKATLRKKKRKCGVCKVNNPVWKFCTECGSGRQFGLKQKYQSVCVCLNGGRKTETCDSCSHPEWVNAIWPTEFPDETGPRLLCIDCKLAFRARKRKMKGKERKRMELKIAEAKQEVAEGELAEAVEDKTSIEAAIRSLEEQRELLGDEATDAAIQPLTDKLVKSEEIIATQREKKPLVEVTAAVPAVGVVRGRGPPRQSVALLPEDEATKYKELAIKAFASGRYQQSFELFSQAIARTPMQGDLWSMRALVQLRMERWPDALKDANQALEYSKGDVSAEMHCRRALALYHLNLLEESLAAYDAASNVNYACPELSNRKLVVSALSKRNQGTMRRIINQAKAGEEAEKSREEGVLELKKGDFLKALEAFTKAIAAAPRHAPYYSHRALVFLKAEQYEDAMADCKRAVELDPLCAHAWSRKGLAHGGLCEFELAFECFNRCSEINPNHPELKERARVEKMKKARDKQLQREASSSGFSKVKVKSDVEPTLPSVRAVEGPNMADLMVKVMELSPKSRRKAVDGLHESALQFAVEGKIAKAIFALEEAIRLDPVSSFLRVDLAELYLNQSRFTDAYHECTTAVCGDGGEDSQAHSRRARALLGLHRFYEAMEEFQQAEDLDPENPELEFGRRFRRKTQLDDLVVPEGSDFGIVIKRADAALLMRELEFEEACKVFSEIIALDPKVYYYFFTYLFFFFLNRFCFSQFFFV